MERLSEWTLKVSESSRLVVMPKLRSVEVDSYEDLKLAVQMSQVSGANE
jgi:CMP-N-acetylneuraminic acid synthetase